MIRPLRRFALRVTGPAFLALAALLAMGCSEDEPVVEATHSAAQTETPVMSKGTRAPATDTSNAAVGREHLIAAMIQGASQEAYRFEWSMSLAGIPSTPPVSLQGSGVVDPAGERYQMSMDLSSILSMVAGSGTLTPQEQAELAALQGAGTMDFLIDGDTAYLRSPLIARELGASTPWVSISAADFERSGMLFGGFSQMVAPTDLPVMLQTVGDLQQRGSESVRGTPTTRWDGTVDLVKLAEAQLGGLGADAADLQELLPMLEAFVPGITRMPVSMWVDSENRPRRLEITMNFPTGAGTAATAAMKMRYELFDFGAGVAVMLPPAAEVTDLGSMFGAPAIR